jgi:hypothetical protein
MYPQKEILPRVWKGLEYKQTLGKPFITIGYIETASKLCELKLYVIQEGRNEENEERKRKKTALTVDADLDLLHSFIRRTRHIQTTTTPIS